MEDGTTLPVMNRKAQYDAACKRILSKKIILAWIMKSCLNEYKDCTVREIAEKYIEGTPEVSTVPVAPDETSTHIQGVGNEDASITEGTVTYDIRFQALAPSDSNKTIQLIINIEAQNDYYPGYPLPKRAIYYCCRMISAQYGTVFDHAHYEKMQKVYSIWICMNPPKNRENTITEYYLAEKQLIGNVQEITQNYDLLSFIMICLGNADSVDDSTLRLLDILFSTGMEEKMKKQILRDEFDITMTHSLESEVSRMCNLSEGIERRGIEKGARQNALANLQALMSNMDLSLEQAMAALNIPEEDRVMYADLLKNS